MVAHAAFCARQAARNQAQTWWGMIDKFEDTASCRQVSIPLRYLKARTDREATRLTRPRCRDQDATSAKTNARTANVAIIARAAILDAKINAAASRVENVSASLALVN